MLSAEPTTAVVLGEVRPETRWAPRVGRKQVAQQHLLVPEAATGWEGLAAVGGAEEAVAPLAHEHGPVGLDEGDVTTAST